MTTPAWITLVLLIAMFVMLVWNKLPIWLVFIGTLTVAMTLRLAPPAALLKGYSNTGVITVAMVVLAATGITSMLNAALLAAMAMLLAGCLTIERLWQSVDWQTIVVMGAAVGLESAITGTGLARETANLFAAIGGKSPVMALAAVYIGTVVLTNVISNVAAAVMMFSVAVSLSTALGVSFFPFAMILMSGVSTAFINPAGFQTNLMVQKPGGYVFSDFVKVGAPLTLIVGAVVLLLAPIVYGF